MRRAEVYRYVFTNRYEDGRVEISKIHLSTFLSLSLCLGSFIPVYPSGRIRGIFFFPPPSGYIDRFSVYRSRIMRRDDE